MSNISLSQQRHIHFIGSSQMSASLKDSLKYLDETNRDVDIIQLPVKPCTLQSVTEKFYSDNVRIIFHVIYNHHKYQYLYIILCFLVILTCADK